MKTIDKIFADLDEKVRELNLNPSNIEIVKIALALRDIEVILLRIRDNNYKGFEGLPK